MVHATPNAGRRPGPAVRHSPLQRSLSELVPTCNPIPATHLAGVQPLRYGCSSRPIRHCDSFHCDSCKALFGTLVEASWWKPVALQNKP